VKRPEEVSRMSPKVRRAHTRLVLLALGLAWGVAGAASARPSEGPLRAFLPGDTAVPGWAKEGEPQEFEGEDLYIYIDGGAEIYEEYGFARIVVQDYKNAAGKSVSLEIFEMGTPAAAFGMFTFKRSGQGKTLDLGAGGELEAYYLNFWAGRFLVTVTGFDESEGTVEGLLSIGRAVAAKLPGGGETPGLAAALPAQGLRPGSVKYLRGLLGLNNVYPLYTARGLAFKDAVRGIYDSGETLILLDYGSAEARRASWRELRAEIERSGRFEPAKNYLADAVAFEDGKGQYVAFGEAGARLAVGIHSTLEGALATVARVR
jgi:hypothetical protein